MCLNQILKTEQLTLMRHAVATTPIDARKHRRKLSLFVKLLDEHPYPHRQYSPSHKLEGHSIPESAGAPLQSPGVAVWENEGGRVEGAGLQKHSNREDRESLQPSRRTDPRLATNPVK